MTQKTLYTGIAVAVTLVVITIFFILGVPFNSSTLNNQQAAAGSAAPVPDQVAVQDSATGTGRAAQPGDTVVVNYTGKLADGTVFDSSVGKQPFSFTLGAGEVIAGWDQGLVGAQVGTKRTLVIPPSLGYGPQAVGPIPANSTLIFDVEVLSITPGTPTPAAH